MKYPIQVATKNHLKQLYKDDQDIIAYALSASHVHSKVELDIWTHETYRGQGISKMLCHRFIAHCKKHNLLPKWNCAEDNTASIKYPLTYIYELKNTK